MDVEKPQRVPLSVFRHCETLARHLVHFFEYVIFSKNFFLKKFRFSSTVKEYLTLGSLFAIFEPWLWRRLGPVPAFKHFEVRKGPLEPKMAPWLIRHYAIFNEIFYTLFSVQFLLFRYF